MSPYHVDLRECVVAAHRRGDGSVRWLAKLFTLAKNTVQNWLTLERQTGRVEPRPHAGGVEATISGETFNTLCALVEERNDATLEALHLSLETKCGIETSRAAVFRALKKAGLTRKRRRSMRTSAIAQPSWRRAPSSAGSNERSTARP